MFGTVEDSGVPGAARTGERRTTIRVLLADSHSLTRMGLRTLLVGEANIHIVAEVADGFAAVAAASRTRPDVLVVTSDLSGIDALETICRIVSQPQLDGVRAVLLTASDAHHHLLAAVRAGVSGVLSKDSPTTQLIEAVRLAADGGALLSAPVARLVHQHLQCRHARQTADAQPALGRLTGREREVVALVGAGRTNGEIADCLYISPATARTHVSRAMVKVGARDRVQLAVFAFHAGLA